MDTSVKFIRFLRITIASKYNFIQRFDFNILIISQWQFLTRDSYNCDENFLLYNNGDKRISFLHATNKITHLDFLNKHDIQR